MGVGKMEELKELWMLKNYLKLNEPDREEILNAMIDYFGQHETRLILNIILYFKYPNKHFYLKKTILKELGYEPAQK